MPVVGLTDNIDEMFPEIGRLRKGAKKTDPKKPGVDLEFFRFTSDRPEIVAAFTAQYGSEPKRVNVIVPEETADENFVVWMEEWGSSLTLKHRCDKIHIVRRWNEQLEEYENFPVGEGPVCPYHENPSLRTKKTPGCSITGRLRVIIPELVAAGYVGYVTVLTGGKHDVRSILGSLRKVERERNGKGLAWMPFTLLRVKQEVSTPGWEEDAAGKRRKVVKDMVKLVPSEDFIRAQVENTRAEYFLPPPAEDSAGIVTRTRWLLHEEAPEVDEITGEILDDDDLLSAAEALGAEISRPIQEAMNFTTDSGKVLGEMSHSDLMDIVAKVDELNTPSARMREIRKHALVLMEHLGSQ